MLKRIERTQDREGAGMAMKEAVFPSPFLEGLEYSSPARGTWNIVHTGMLIPESHQIFVCAQGCLRGVVMTAAEMNQMGRYSAIMIREENVLDGTMETLMIEGTADILAKLSYRPKAVLLFISCQHFFLAYDQNYVFSTLRERFPEIVFMDCYMIPTLRKSGLTPDQKMRIQLFGMLHPCEKKKQVLNLLGSNLPLCENSEWKAWLTEEGFEVRQLHDCKSFEEYLAMAEAEKNLYYEPLAAAAAEDLERRLGQEGFYLPFVYRSEPLEEGYERLAEALGIRKPDFTKQRERAEKALRQAKAVIGDAPVAVDASFTFRILNFTRMLLENGFHVTELYADSFLPEEAEDFEWLKEHAPELFVSAVSRPKMRFLKREREEKTLAVGQKAAYFTGTDHFVNVVESGGYFGYEGICCIAGMMQEAFLHKKDRKALIQRKGFGCESCI